MRIYLVLILLFLSVGFACKNRNISGNGKDKIELSPKLAPYFIVPDQYKNQSGNYRPVLNFYDGRKVNTARDWADRRKEIFNRWDSLLGKWPPVIKDQRLNIVESKKRENFTQHRITFNWLPNEETYGYLLVPEGSEIKPAVITVFYEPETAIGVGGKPYRDFAYQLAKRGFVTLSLGTTAATKRKTYSLFYPDIDHSQSQPLSLLAYAAANAYEALAKFDGVDPKRIGITGHSFGGKWAMFASCLYDKFACAAWSDPGIVFDKTRPAVNYWEPYYLGYHPQPWRKRGNITKENPARGLYTALVGQGYDLHELHALMAPRPFLVSGGSEDPESRWMPLNSTIAVNKLLGYQNRVGMTNRPLHDPNSESNEVMYSFFEHFLK